jgi:hypothetical protein
MLNLPSFQPSEPRDLRNLPQVTATKFIIPKFKTTTDLVLHVDIVFSFVVCFGKSWFVVLKQYSLFNRFSRYYMSLKVGIVSK